MAVIGGRPVIGGVGRSAGQLNPLGEILLANLDRSRQRDFQKDQIRNNRLMALGDVLDQLFARRAIEDEEEEEEV
jgi:hypothetical protein